MQPCTILSILKWAPFVQLYYTRTDSFPSSLTDAGIYYSKWLPGIHWEDAGTRHVDNICSRLSSKGRCFSRFSCSREHSQHVVNSPIRLQMLFRLHSPHVPLLTTSYTARSNPPPPQCVQTISVTYLSGGRCD